jgi:hypothetical protein
MNNAFYPGLQPLAPGTILPLIVGLRELSKTRKSK